MLKGKGSLVMQRFALTTSHFGQFSTSEMTCRGRLQLHANECLVWSWLTPNVLGVTWSNSVLHGGPELVSCPAQAVAGPLRTA